MFLEKQQFRKLYDLLLKEPPLLADAIIWLQGDRYSRAFKVLKLYKDGWSKKIVISGNNILIGKEKRLGENNISLDQMKQFLFKKGISAKSLIIDDEAMNTKNQAEHLIKMAIDKRWSRLILVGSSYYQPRAFLTFLKQAEKLKWTGEIINQPVVIDLNKKPGGRDKSAKMLLNEEFKKIEKYKKDLSTISQGIKYLNK